ncbi:MAG: multicopper oxidase family protein [Sneathiella sp.]
MPLLVLLIASLLLSISPLANSAEKTGAQMYVEEFQAFLGSSADTGQVKAFNLTASPVEIMRDGKTATRWAYNGQLPGPVLRVQKGDRVQVTLTNDLPQNTTIHWHGVRVPNAMDGVPFLTQIPVKPGKSFTYDFVPQDAGTYWFHPHVRGHEQLERGLYGTLIVEDQFEGKYDQDIVWMLDDVLTEDDGSLGGDFDFKFLDTGGRLGNSITVNGENTPNFTFKAGERIRLRIVNPSNARNYRLSFANLPSAIIAVDGNLVGEPQQVDAFNIVPGNRVDIDLTIPKNLEGQSVDIANTFFHREAGGSAVEGPQTIAKISIVGKVAKQKTFALPVHAAVPDWTNALNEKPDFIFDFDTAFDISSLWTNKAFVSFTINNKVFGDHDITQLKNNKFYRMRFNNGTGLYHPIHIHGVFFKVLARDGVPVNEPYFRDTALLDYDGSLDIGVVPADLGEWLSHCHLLEHAALGMKSTINVTD